MSVKSAPYWWVVCDSCGLSAQSDDEYAAWADVDSAEESASCREWSTNGQGQHHCDACEPFCAECPNVAGPLSGERDYLCQDCWDKAEAAT